MLIFVIYQRSPQMQPIGRAYETALLVLVGGIMWFAMWRRHRRP
jgi:hypothetical protein